MIKTNLGKISITNKGEYSAATTYETLDVVSFNGSSYMAKQQTVGNSPENTNYWQLLAAKGDTPVKGVDYFTQADIASLPMPDLSGYALASDVYSKDDVDDMVAAIESSALKRIIVQELPAVNISSNAIYMIRNLSSSGQNQYDEFMWNENDGSGRWEYIGNTQVDLTGYATESWVNNQGFLKTHQDISGKANSADLATVATTGDYTDLINTPTIPVMPTLANVATSGSYNDLSNKPSIPSKTSDLTNDSGFITSANIDLSGYMRKGIDYVTAGQMNGAAKGSNSTAEGLNTKASGNMSHAEGANTTSSGTYSHAEGYDTTASGDTSHAEGNGTYATNTYTHAEGFGSSASGYASHAEGNHSHATGASSHAEGYETSANHKSQHVFGEYNIADPSTASGGERGNYVEIVGNGTSGTRSNARTLDWNGNEVLAGKLTVGTGPTANMDVATKQYVDNATSNVSYTETDPTVPSWAKASTKPTYTKSEVGLGNVDNVKQYSVNNPPPYPVTSVNGQIGAVTISVPTKTSDLTNDSGFATRQDVIGKQDAFPEFPEGQGIMYAPVEVDGEYDWFQLTDWVYASEDDQYLILGDYTVNLGNGLSLTEDQESEGTFTLEASGSSGGATYTAGNGINIDAKNVISKQVGAVPLYILLDCIMTGPQTGQYNQSAAQTVWSNNTYLKTNIEQHIANLKAYGMTYVHNGTSQDLMRAIVPAMGDDVNSTFYFCSGYIMNDQYTISANTSSASKADDYMTFGLNTSPTMIIFNPYYDYGSPYRWYFIKEPYKRFQNHYFVSKQGLTSHSIAAAIDEVASRIPAAPIIVDLTVSGQPTQQSDGTFSIPFAISSQNIEEAYALFQDYPNMVCFSIDFGTLGGKIECPISSFYRSGSENDYTYNMNGKVSLDVGNGLNLDNLTVYAYTDTNNFSNNIIGKKIAYANELTNVAGIPAAPSTDGSYILKCTVASGVPTYTWEAAT